MSFTRLPSRNRLWIWTLFSGKTVLWDPTCVMHAALTRPQIIVATNPATLKLNGHLRVTVTSADPVGPILGSLVSKGCPTSERVTVAHQAILNQLSLYPCHPADMPIDPLRFGDPPCVWASPEDLPHVIVYCSDRLPSGARVGWSRMLQFRFV